MVRHYRFDDIEIDLDGFRLSKAGDPIAIEPKALHLLIFLVENRGRLVTRRELIDSVWSGAFVTDHVLNRAVGQLRKALPDDPKQPRYIETVPTLGYRFIGNVEAEAPPRSTAHAAREEERDAGPMTPAESESQDRAGDRHAADAPRPLRFRTRPARLALGMALAAALCAGAAWMVVRWVNAANAGRIRSLVVLPLDNLSGDAGQQYLADGMTDELITGLGQIGALRVISHTTAMRYRNTKEPLPQIARELDVDAVIEGSVLRSGDRVRVAAELVSASSEKQLWSQSYEGDIGDVLGLEHRVAGAVADQVRVKLTRSIQTNLADPQRVNPQAYEALLKGNYFFHQNSPETTKKSLEYFRQAIQLDPNFARAYVGVARSYNLMGDGAVPAGEATAAADAALAKALQLEPGLAEAYAERGWTLLFYHWDFPGTERDFRQSLELDPGSSDAHEGYANYLVAVGRVDEGLQEIRTARDLDPLSPMVLSGYCNLLFMARRFSDAKAQCSAALELDPNYSWALNVIADIYEIEGEYAPAHTIYKKLYGCEDVCADGADEEFGRPGKLGKFDAWMQTSPALGSGASFYLAEAYAGIGNKDKAFAMLERSYAQRISMHGLAFLAVDPHFDNLRSDPRFDAFLRRAGLPPQPKGLQLLITHSTKP